MCHITYDTYTTFIMWTSGTESTVDAMDFYYKKDEAIESHLMVSDRRPTTPCNTRATGALPLRWSYREYHVVSTWKHCRW